MAITWQPGMRVTAERMNAAADIPLCCLAQATTAQTLVTGGWYVVLFQDNPASVQVDTHGMFTFSSAGRATSKLRGWYMVGGSVAFSTNGTGQRGGAIYKNGSVVQGHATFEPPNAAQISAYALPTRPVFLDVGDYVELRAFQSSGGGLTTHVGTDHTCSLTLAYHAPG